MTLPGYLYCAAYSTSSSAPAGSDIKVRLQQHHRPSSYDCLLTDEDG